jgi:uncharacterized phage protein (TIGR01671 family)
MSNSRAIKLRAWFINGKHKTFDSQIMSMMEDRSLAEFLNSVEDAELDHGIQAILMQFTGLKDKNGKEIFEGDVVKCKMITQNDILPHEGEVVFVEEFGGFATKNQAGKTLFHNHLIDSFEVIGNIYESPELLET